MLEGVKQHIPVFIALDGLFRYVKAQRAKEEIHIRKDLFEESWIKSEIVKALTDMDRDELKHRLEYFIEVLLKRYQIYREYNEHDPSDQDDKYYILLEWCIDYFKENPEPEFIYKRKSDWPSAMFKINPTDAEPIKRKTTAKKGIKLTEEHKAKIKASFFRNRMLDAKK